MCIHRVCLWLYSNIQFFNLLNNNVNYVYVLLCSIFQMFIAELPQLSKRWPAFGRIFVNEMVSIIQRNRSYSLPPNWHTIYVRHCLFETVFFFVRLDSNSFRQNHSMRFSFYLHQFQCLRFHSDSNWKHISFGYDFFPRTLSALSHSLSFVLTTKSICFKLSNCTWSRALTHLFRSKIFFAILSYPPLSCL